MRNSMFARLFSLFMAVILFVLVLISVFTYYTIRDMRINSRMDELKKEAREIAYLASQTRITSLLGRQSASELLLNWKVEQVYKEFGAYIAVVDRQGRLLENIQTVSQNDPDFKTALDGKEMTNMLLAALNGRDVQLQTTFPGTNDPVFIVAVPWVEEQTVLGAVFIHTSAQVIHASYESLIWQVFAVMMISAVLCGLVVFFYVRRITRPLTFMATAAGQMAKGDFEVRLETASLKEVDELAEAFNIMAQKLGELEDSRREFVANVSHELRSPITSIRGYIEGMRDGTLPPSEHSQYLTIVSDETKRLTKLISDLLSLSRMEQRDAPLNPTHFDISELIRRVLIRRMNDIDHKDLEMDIQLPEEPLFALADQDRIEQVLTNLLDNAIKFTPDGGKLTIILEDIGKDISVTVSDTGEGILPDDREHIFERFFTADRAHTAGKGTGLGLSICKHIMDLHGKTIALLPGKEGASFRITLSKGELAK